MIFYEDKYNYGRGDIKYKQQNIERREGDSLFWFGDILREKSF